MYTTKLFILANYQKNPSAINVARSSKPRPTSRVTCTYTVNPESLPVTLVTKHLNVKGDYTNTALLIQQQKFLDVISVAKSLPLTHYCQITEENTKNRNNSCVIFVTNLSASEPT